MLDNNCQPYETKVSVTCQCPNTRFLLKIFLTTFVTLGSGEQHAALRKSSDDGMMIGGIPFGSERFVVGNLNGSIIHQPIANPSPVNLLDTE